MDLQFAGKRVFVSGSTQGIGYAIAAAFASEGAEVVLNGRSDVDTAVERLRSAHPTASVSGIAADFADPRAVHGLIDTLGQVDVVVNNVGVFDLADITELPDSEWTRSFEINVMSGVRLSRALLPGMLEAGWGRIVFIGTESAVDVPGDMIHYGATKAAALALSNGLAKLTKGTGVTVNTVLGGPTYSDGVARTVEAIASRQGVAPDVLRAALVRTSSLVQRFIEPEEIAAFVAFLASPRASATNGAALRVDGGVLPTTL
jgi:NAD(P)-dependent dehydrogenase (short-subunit alcohol dehydrogenase family)